MRKNRIFLTSFKHRVPPTQQLAIVAVTSHETESTWRASWHGAVHGTPRRSCRAHGSPIVRVVVPVVHSAPHHLVLRPQLHSGGEASRQSARILRHRSHPAKSQSMIPAPLLTIIYRTFLKLFVQFINSQTMKTEVRLIS